MMVFADAVTRRRFSCIGLAGAVFLVWSIAGCGPSSEDSPQELSPEAKKTLIAKKVGDPSKFVKPQAGGGRRP